MNNSFEKIFTKEEIFAQLEEMGAPRDKVVLMHSSLRLIGKIEGGAEALLDVLIDYFTSQGGLFCVPTHTWNDLDKEITLDMASTRNCLGAFSTLAAGDKRGLRSENPTHSMMVFGDRKRAEDFVKDEPFVVSGTAPDSCYGKIYDEGGAILLVGVAQNRNTYIHSISERLGMENRVSKEPWRVAVKKLDGSVYERGLHVHQTDYTKDISLRFPKYETAFRYHGCITDGSVGNAPTQLCDARGMKEVIELILRNNGGKDPLTTEEPISQLLYCKK